MTESQHIVNAINEGWKTEKRVQYTFHNPNDGGMDSMIFSWDEIEDGLVRLWKRRKFVVIDRKIVDVPVGTTPKSEQHTGGYLE
jgi:hypothetical protein